jgi:hypothetical protein
MAQPAAIPSPDPIPLFVNARSGSADKVLSALRRQFGGHEEKH